MNWKKIAIATVALTVVWFVMDFVIHGVLLMNLYKESAHFWRPMEEMNPIIGAACTLVFAFLFTMFYVSVVRPKNLSTGLKFGIWLGLLWGVSMGGMYMFMPIPLMLAIGWFSATLVESVVGGVVVGYLTKD